MLTKQLFQSVKMLKRSFIWVFWIVCAKKLVDFRVALSIIFAWSIILWFIFPNIELEMKETNYGVIQNVEAQFKNVPPAEF